MTDAVIQKQIEDIRKVTAEAIKSKESARKFLIDAGIIKEGKEQKITFPGKRRKRRFDVSPAFSDNWSQQL